MNIPRLETERLYLEIVRPRFFKYIYPLFNRHDVLDWMTFDYPINPSNTKAFCKAGKKNAHKGTSFDFTIIKKGNNQPIGCIGINSIMKQHKRAYIGYWLGYKDRGKGYLSEALDAVLDFGFNTLQLHKIQARTHHNNEASIKVLTKKGFEQHGYLKEDLLKYGKWIDGLEFELLNEQWNRGKNDCQQS